MKRQADKHTEPGLEHPGKKRTRTGTSGRHKPWTGTSREVAALDWLPGQHKEEEAAAARKRTENMDKSDERKREDTKNMNRDEGGEGDEGAAQKESTDSRQNKKEKDGRHGATDWNIRGPEEATRQRIPLDWNIRGDASRHTHGARTGTSGEERTGRQKGHRNGTSGGQRLGTGTTGEEGGGPGKE